MKIYYLLFILFLFSSNPLFSVFQEVTIARDGQIYNNVFFSEPTQSGFRIFFDPSLMLAVVVAPDWWRAGSSPSRFYNYMNPGSTSYSEVIGGYAEFPAPQPAAPYAGWDNERMRPWQYVSHRGGVPLRGGKGGGGYTPCFVIARMVTSTTVVTPPSPSATPVSNYNAPIPADLLAILTQIDFPKGALSSAKAVFKTNETVTLNFSVQ